MDFNTAKSVFTSLYSGINGYTISQRARKKLAYTDKAHTYGEVTPEGFSGMLADVEYKKGGVFYDLGSGTGKGVILSAMFGDFSKIVGIEIIEELFKTSKNILSRFDQEVRLLLDPVKQNSKIDFINSNFLEYDFSDADLIFTHSTCFYDELMLALERKFSNLNKGTKVITVTKSLISPLFKFLKSDEYLMTWGKATVNFYEKI